MTHPARKRSGPRRGARRQGFERPSQRPARHLRPRFRRRGHVLAPHVPARPAGVAAQRHLQGRRPPPERLVRQPATHAVTHAAFATTAPAPPVLCGDPAGELSAIGPEALAGHHQAETVETAERGQIRRSEATRASSVKQVGVFRSGCVRTPIIGRPRPSHADAHTRPSHTLNREEPSRAASSTSAGPLSASATRANYIARSLLEAGGFRPRLHPQL
jgi:hypothetical protein